MTEPTPLCILVTLHPGGMTRDQFERGEALDITPTGHFIWADAYFPAVPPARWHIIEDEFAEAVRAELERQRKEEE